MGASKFRAQCTSVDWATPSMSSRIQGCVKAGQPVAKWYFTHCRVLNQRTFHRNKCSDATSPTVKNNFLILIDNISPLMTAWMDKFIEIK